MSQLPHIAAASPKKTKSGFLLFPRGRNHNPSGRKRGLFNFTRCPSRGAPARRFCWRVCASACRGSRRAYALVNCSLLVAFFLRRRLRLTRSAGPHRATRARKCGHSCRSLALSRSARPHSWAPFPCFGACGASVFRTCLVRRRL